MAVPPPPALSSLDESQMGASLDAQQCRMAPHPAGQASYPAEPGLLPPSNGGRAHPWGG